MTKETYFFTRSRRNGARKRAIASADSRSRKPRRLNFHSIQWNSLPSVFSPRARHGRGAVPRRGANAGVSPATLFSPRAEKYLNIEIYLVPSYLPIAEIYIAHDAYGKLSRM